MQNQAQRRYPCIMAQRTANSGSVLGMPQLEDLRLQDSAHSPQQQMNMHQISSGPLSVPVPSDPTPTSRHDSSRAQALIEGPLSESGSDTSSEIDGEGGDAFEANAGCPAITTGKNSDASVVPESSPLHHALETVASFGESSAGDLETQPIEEDVYSVKNWKLQAEELQELLETPHLPTEEKLQTLQLRHLQQAAEGQQLESELLAWRRKCQQAGREKESLYAELSRGSAVQLRLESLCRELQRQNKAVLDESKRVAAEEQQKRQELSTKFHTTITEITGKLEEQGEERLRQIRENETLRETLKHLTQQYELREHHFGHQLRTKGLEQQLLDARLKQQHDAAAQESRRSKDKIAQLQKTEVELRAQLGLYGDKFEQFQETLTKSNEVFATFKKEMEKMSKTIKRLEKENAALKAKCEKSDVSIIELLDERSVQKRQLETSRVQKERLEALCRSLQSERRAASAAAASAPPTPAPAALSPRASQTVSKASVVLQNEGPD